MKDLVRCRPCGFVIEADKLGDKCPACGLPRKVFEPYRERVSANRKTVLNLDLHPIAIHLSQSLVILIPVLILSTTYYPNFFYDILKPVLIFSVFIFPFTLILSFLSGMVDGLVRFKTLKTPFLISKIIYSSIILISAFTLFTIAPDENYGIKSLLLSIICLIVGVRLGLLGKKLIDVILPGPYPIPLSGKKKPVRSENKNETTEEA